MAWAVIRAVEGGSSQRVFNVVDDHPVCYEELYQYIAAMVNGPDPNTRLYLYLFQFHFLHL